MEPDIVCALLEKIRARPGMLYGYAIREMEINPKYAQNNAFWSGFRRYVEDYYHVKSAQGWRRIIEFYSTSREDAFGTFFQRYDEYLAAYRESAPAPLLNTKPPSLSGAAVFRSAAL